MPSEIAEVLDREVMIAVKAYPQPSTKYGETSCVAGITREEGWVRLYPVQFRALDQESQFHKYQMVRLRMSRHGSDQRPESFRPDQSSIMPGAVIPSADGWAARRSWVEPTISESMCWIRARQAETGMSLGAIRPAAVEDLEFEDVDPDFAAAKSAALSQQRLFEREVATLQKIPLTVRYRYRCADSACKGHCQSIVDWELGQLYRNLAATGRNAAEIRAAIRAKFLDELCGAGKDVVFFVGNNHQHPVSFMVLGVFWPKLDAQARLW